MLEEIAISDIIIYLILAAFGLDRGTTFFQTRKAKTNGNGKVDYSTQITDLKNCYENQWVRIDENRKETNQSIKELREQSTHNMSEFKEKMSEKMEKVAVGMATIKTMIKNIEDDKQANFKRYESLSNQVYHLGQK